MSTNPDDKDLEVNKSEEEKITENNSANDNLTNPSEHEDKNSEEDVKLKESLLRAYAEIQNMQKDEKKRLLNVKLLAHEEICKSVLEVMDSFNYALKILDNNTASGLKMIQDELMKKLNKFGVKEIVVNVGNVFDPKMHIAIETISGEEKGKIAEVISNAYSFGENNKLIKPAQVKVVN